MKYDLSDLGWEDVRIVLAVHEAGSFRAGSLAARVSLNTVRAAVVRVEKLIGKPLFVRSIKGVTITHTGVPFIAAAEAMRAALRYHLS